MKDRKGNEIGIGTRVDVKIKGTRVIMGGVVYDLRRIRNKDVIRVVIPGVKMKAQVLARSVRVSR